MARVLLGVSGGIAAYKAVYVARGLMTAGHDVHVLPTAGALTMVGAATWEGITGHPVHSSVFDHPREHVELGRDADLIVIAPATAHALAKLANGLADDLLSSTALMATCPLVIAPAMHTQMWEHPATRENVATLVERGAVVVGPGTGDLAAGDSGTGRMSEPDEIVERALGVLRPAARDLAGVTVLVTAGGTREPLDPVRFLGNRSSGRQGLAVAREARDRGAAVHVIAANVSAEVRAGIPVHAVVTTAQMQQAVTELAARSDVVVMAAAVADYRPESTRSHKMKKQDSLELRLVRNPDILAGLVGARRDGQIIVGFAAETGDDGASARAHAEEKARRKGADLLIFNEVSETAGFGDVPNAVAMLDARGNVVGEASGSKADVAAAVIDEIVRMRCR